MQTTLEVVEEEVGSLRRLVSEFSSFARLPQAELAPADLGEFFRGERDHLTAESPSESPSIMGDASLLQDLDLTFEIPDGAMPVEIEREMLHRGFGNLVRNAAQAIRDARDAAVKGSSGGPNPRSPTPSERWTPRDKGKIAVTVRRDADFCRIDIDDSGPGIEPDLLPTIFDPYVTTKRDGTGLGLCIVKKIIVDHGGTIDAAASPLGGARLRIRLPRAGTTAAKAARESLARSAEAPPSFS